MRKVISIALIVSLVVILCACGAGQIQTELEEVSVVEEEHGEILAPTELPMREDGTEITRTDIEKREWKIKTLTLKYLNQEITDKEKLYLNAGKTVIDVLADKKRTKDYNVISSDSKICSCSIAEQGQLILNYSGIGESTITIQIGELNQQFIVCQPEQLMLQYKGKKFAPKSEIYLPFDEEEDSISVLWNGEIYENFQTYTHLNYVRWAATISLQPTEPGCYPLAIHADNSWKEQFYIVYIDPTTGEIPEKIDYDLIIEENQPTTDDNPISNEIAEPTTGEISKRIDYDPIIDYYQIPTGLGNPQYSVSEIKQMIDDNLTLDEVAEKISTVADLVQYLHQKKYSADHSGDIHFRWNGRYWSINRNAQGVFRNNKGNCGGDSNLVNYILRGDYDEQGYVCETGNTGGHVYNYFKENGVYYFMDLTLIVLSEGTYDNGSYRIYATMDPNEHSKYYIGDNHMENSSTDEGYLLLHYMYERNGNHVPLGWSEVRTVCDRPYVVLSKEIESTVKFLYIDESVSKPEFVQAPPKSEWPKEAR